MWRTRVETDPYLGSSHHEVCEQFFEFIMVLYNEGDIINVNKCNGVLCHELLK